MLAMAVEPGGGGHEWSVESRVSKKRHAGAPGGTFISLRTPIGSPR